MSRNSGGTYTLPAGNPVTTGTTISSTWANGTLTDIATALTDSLSRSGLGAMTAPLQLAAGVIGAPGLTWSLETTAGFYRAGAGDFRFAIGGVDVATVVAGGLTARAFVPSASTVPSNGMYLPSANTLSWATNTTLAMTLSSVGALTTVGSQTGTAMIPTGSAVPVNGLYLSAANTLAFSSNTTLRGSVNSTGNWVLAAPSSGVALSVVGLSGVTSPAATFENASSIARLEFKRTAVGSWFIGGPSVAGNSFEITLNAGVADISIDTSHVVSAYSRVIGAVSEVGDRLLNRLTSASSPTLDISYSGAGLELTGASPTLTGYAAASGTSITCVFNGSGTLSVTPGSGTLSWFNGSGTISTGNRSVAVGGVFTLWRAGTNWYIWGTGIT